MNIDSNQPDRTTINQGRSMPAQGEQTASAYQPLSGDNVGPNPDPGGDTQSGQQGASVYQPLNSEKSEGAGSTGSEGMGGSNQQSSGMDDDGQSGQRSNDNAASEYQMTGGYEGPAGDVYQTDASHQQGGREPTDLRRDVSGSAIHGGSQGNAMNGSGQQDDRSGTERGNAGQSGSSFHESSRESGQL